jgi:hypothetical protein
MVVINAGRLDGPAGTGNRLDGERAVRPRGGPKQAASAGGSGVHFILFRSSLHTLAVDLRVSLDISRTSPTSLLTCDDGGESPHHLVIALVYGSARIVAGQPRCRVPFGNFV